MHLKLLNCESNLISGTNKLSFLSAQNSLASLTANFTTTTEKDKTIVVKQSSFPLIETGFMETRLYYEHLLPDLKHLPNV